MVATINLATNSQKLLTQPWPCAACHAPRKSFLLFCFKCWQLCYTKKPLTLLHYIAPHRFLNEVAFDSYTIALQKFFCWNVQLCIHLAAIFYYLIFSKASVKKL